MTRLIRRIRCWMGLHEWTPSKGHVYYAQYLTCTHCGITVTYRPSWWERIRRKMG